MPYKRTTFLALAVWLAASPAFAQVRTGVSVESGLSGVTGAPQLGGGLSAAPALAPSLSAASLNGALSAPAAAAPALIPTALQPAIPAASRPALESLASTRGTLEALAPQNLGKVTGESAKVLSGKLLGLEEGVPAISADPVTGSFSAASTPELGPSSHHDSPAAKAPARPDQPPVKPSIADKIHFARLLFQNYYWYSVTHIVDMWPGYRQRYDEAKAKGWANVTRPREFFAYMRIAATSGRFYVLGAAPLEDEAVIAEMRATFLKWFDAPAAVGPREIAAFDAFTARARHYNAERRAPSNMRKHIRDAILKAATMDPAKMAAFFDSLLVEETAHETADFQNKGAQKRILDAFKQTMRETLAEEPAGARGRVEAAILLGSFATGSAGPKSDFDVELLTAGGSSARVEAFIKRLTDRWIATGHHARNPVTVHDFPSTPSRGIVDLVHTGDFIVISLDEGLAERLQRKPEDYMPPMIRKDSLRGAVNRALQFGIIVGSTYVGQARHWLFGPSHKPGHG